MFDNFTMKTNYGAYDRAGAGAGAKLDMTNWCRMAVPRLLAPAGFNASAIFAGGIFRSLSISRFRDSFRLNHPDIASNKASRWVTFVRACQSGTMFTRPHYISTWRAQFTYFTPMPDVLQSSNAHVRFEVNLMRREVARLYPGCVFLFVGGDGLALMRMNHLLCNDPTYLNMTPVLIPVQGEAPHGTFHVLHAGWRMYSAFIEEALSVQLRNPMYRADPTVKDFNHCRFMLFVLVRACTEYCIEMSQTAGGHAVEDHAGFMHHASNNIDFAWVVQFLDGFGFLSLQFQQAVRSNDSATLDLLWREFYGLAHNARANKTQYCPMAILRVYWGLCLVDPLRDLYLSDSNHTFGQGAWL